MALDAAPPPFEPDPGHAGEGTDIVAHSKLIAGLIGPLLAAMGCALLSNRELFPVIIDQISHDYALIFLSGMLLLVAGIAVVRVHNVWSGWQVVVTAFGWLAIVSGLARMWMPQMAGPVADTFAARPAALPLAGVALLLVGGFLTYKAYISTPEVNK